MMPTSAPAIIDPTALPMAAHPRFAGVGMQQVFTQASHPFASLGLVFVPPGGVIGRHIHPNEIEVVHIRAGRAILITGESERTFAAGQFVAIPIGMEHGLRNEEKETVELITFFTPPIF
jgi:quercetin dioxygenase-like cupin family protein